MSVDDAMMKTIVDHIHPLTDEQITLLQKLGELYKVYNSQVNVISRKDIDNIYNHHILHSLLLSKFVSFKKGSRILDLGTGGGLPGLPLAIYFPDCEFVLIDGTRKKIDVVNSICNDLSLANVTALQCRAEYHKGSYDFVVSRAVASLDILLDYSKSFRKKKEHRNKGGALLAFKGGDLSKEYNALPKYAKVQEFILSLHVDLAYYETKKIVYIQ